MSKTITIDDESYNKLKTLAMKEKRTLNMQFGIVLDDYLAPKPVTPLPSSTFPLDQYSPAIAPTPVQEAIVDKLYDAGLRRKAIEDEIYSRPDIAQLKQEIDDVNAQLEDIEDSGEAKVLIEKIKELNNKRDSLISEAKVEANI